MEDGDDPIVEELRRIRWQICKKVGGTPEAYARYYLEMDREKVAALKAAEAAKSAKTPPVRGKRARKAAKPAVRVSSGKPPRRRKASTATA